VTALDDPFTERLQPGERITWRGVPDQGRWFTDSDLWLVPISVVWVAFVVFWNVQTWHLRNALPFHVFGGVFLVVGAYFLVGRLFVRRARNRRTGYALTDRRALIAGPRSFTAVPLDRVSIHEMPSRNGQRITVTFGGSPGGWGFGRPGLPANSGMDILMWNRHPPAFYDVEDVLGVRTALRASAGD
jgi:hypothetical protein